MVVHNERAWDRGTIGRPVRRVQSLLSSFKREKWRGETFRGLSSRGGLELAHYPQIFWESRDWPNVGPGKGEESLSALTVLRIGLPLESCFVLAVLGLPGFPNQLESAGR